MSTIVSLTLAAVLSFLGHEMPSETSIIFNSEFIQKEVQASNNRLELIDTNCCLLKNEQSIKVQEIR
ncbi:hypothetical protein [Ulvibacter antarcticus]|uniref:Uncharacterized protein n=1 Tax=Ulvibacter antarcticus TaxID=442714 RepID=A0A3L9Z332_9FLAO|nr:hypothetical protein [Ulvibacter antarcticus]RMA64748.1 hypothetical protein BXY75_1629 [Ulvibacter antarcticus]